jgi:uncharacterized protein (DUF1800 family)
MNRSNPLWPRVVFVALLLAPAVGRGVALSPDQQSCVNYLNKYGARVGKSQNKASVDCVKNAGQGKLENLGIPPQAQTAQACLTNDVRGRIARDALKVQDRDADRCLESPEQLPSFGYAGATDTVDGFRNAGLGIVAGLFGPNLDAAIVSAVADADGARCQSDVLRYATDVFKAIWKVALTGKRDALRGVNRVTGTNPSAPVASAIDLEAELIAVVQADAKGKIAKAALKLHDKAAQRCAATATTIGSMFPGCTGATTPAGAADCGERLARGAFYQALASADALSIDCDWTDNGAGDLSCESPELREHVLNRLGYGPDAWTRARIQTLGVTAYIQEQLSPQTIDDGALDAALAQFPSLTQTFAQLRANYDNNPVPPQQGLGVIARELKQAKVLRSVMSRRQLAEVLVDFWMNHFNVAAASSGRTKYDISPYDRIAIRPNVLSSFETLLLANAKSPAMGDYLDNRRNRVNAINENYGREVLELHTVSVTGPYTEADIVELARCLTGWEEDYNNAVDGFEFRSVFHDQGTKTVMGVSIPANGGINDGLTMIDFLAHHPSTAQFISRKLVIRFVSETPPQRLVDEAAGVFLATGGDIRAVLEAIFTSPEFLTAPQYRHAKVKRPLHFFASAVRALGANPTAMNTNTLRNRVAQLGEDLYDWGPPTGFPDVSPFWISPGTAIRRINEAESMSRGSYGLSFTYPIAGGTSAQIVDALAAQLFLGPLSPDTRGAAIGFLDVLPEPVASQRIEQAAAVLLSTPEFLTH